LSVNIVDAATEIAGKVI